MTLGTLPRRRALVTGASSGIGRAFAHVLAEHGYDLVLSARRRDRLEALATDVSTRYGVRAILICEDLADSSAGARIVAALEAQALSIDALVNNAGYGVPGSYASTSWSQQADFVQVMVTAVAELTHRLLPHMIEQRWGRVINVASLAGLLPSVAGHTLYAASKAFLIKFSESLALETRRHGIHVTAVCPGFVHTEFHDVTGTRAQVSTMPKFMWLDADYVARTSYDAVEAGVPIFVPGRLNRSMATMARLLPQSVVMGLMQRNAGRFRRV